MNKNIDPNELEIFDYASFRRRMLDDDEIMTKMISGVMERIPVMVDILRNHIEQGKINQAGRQAHTIKGVAANLGSESFRRAALAIELAAESNEIDKIKLLFPELENEWERLKPFLKNIIS